MKKKTVKKAKKKLQTEDSDHTPRAILMGTFRKKGYSFSSKKKLDDKLIIEALIGALGILAGALAAAPSNSMKHDAKLGGKFKSNWK